MLLTIQIITQILMSFVLHLARGQIFGLVLWFGLRLGSNWWWVGFFYGSCQSIWFMENCSGFSSVSERCLLNSDCRGTD